MVAMYDILSQAIPLRIAAMAAAHKVLVERKPKLKLKFVGTKFWPYRCDRFRYPGMEASCPANCVGYPRCAGWRHLDYETQDDSRSWDPHNTNDVESAFEGCASGEVASEETAFEEIASAEIAFEEIAFGVKVVARTFAKVIEATEAYEMHLQMSREPQDLLFSTFPLPSLLAELQRQGARPFSSNDRRAQRGRSPGSS